MTVNELFEQLVVERWQRHADDIARQCLVWMVLAVVGMATAFSLLVLVLTGGLSA